MRFLLIAGLLFGGAVEVHAAQKFHLIYTNGIRNSVQDAQYSAQQLKLKLLVKLKASKPNEEVLWEEQNSSLAYNFDDSIAREIQEVYQQKKSERDRLFWEWYQTACGENESFRRLVYEEMVQCRLDHRIDETLWQHREIYLQHLRDGFDLMVVAHSQGNLFANALYDRIQLDAPDLTGRIHVLALATPASIVAGGGPHITLTSDGVINSLLPLLLEDGLIAPLKPNVTNTIPRPGFMDHEFVRHYLEGNQSGLEILRILRSKLVRARGM